mmetsp:Transcript_31586/g.26614  ORF Transcript_31586/g.26614 Transcript_31586/m.26614 type:complete len:95 (-) Transcript_31586:274-558(-)
MPKLEILVCSNNQIENFDASNLLNLIELDLSFNKLTYSISKFYNLPVLKTINLNTNFLKGLNEVESDSIQLKSLQYLMIEDNMINSLKSMSVLS